MITEILLAINVIIFIIQMLFPNFTELIMFNPATPFELWRFITSMFAHGGLMHLLFNMYALFIFGKVVEKKVNLLLIYLVAGIVGSVAYLFLAQAGIIPMMPALGASGAVYGILGAFAILYPDVKLYSLFFPFGLKGKYAVFLFAGFEFFMMFSDDGIGHAAHLGGLAVGLILAYLMQPKYEIHYQNQVKYY